MCCNDPGGGVNAVSMGLRTLPQRGALMDMGNQREEGPVDPSEVFVQPHSPHVPFLTGTPEPYLILRDKKDDAPGQCNSCPKTNSGRLGGCFPGQEVNSEPWETGPDVAPPHGPYFRDVAPPHGPYFR